MSELQRKTIMIEIDQIRLTHQELRLQDPAREKLLVASIAEHGIREPLWGVSAQADPDNDSGGVILLDGFKRLRCARKLRLTTVPWHELGEDEAQGMLALLYMSNARGLHLLEQARLVDCLNRRFGIGVSEIARRLERSPAWVSVRLGMLAEMGAITREAVFSGKFPARSYLYMVRHFTRVKGVPKSEADRFVEKLSGKNLSGRQVDELAEAYFQGSPGVRSQVDEGKIAFALEELHRQKQQIQVAGGELTPAERGLVRDLEIAHSACLRVNRKADHPSLATAAFLAQAEVLVCGIQSLLPAFQQSLEKIDVRCRAKKNSFGAVSTGRSKETNRPTPQSRPQDGPFHHPGRGQFHPQAPA